MAGNFDAMQLFLEWAQSGFHVDRRPNIRALEDSSFSAIVAASGMKDALVEYENDLVEQHFDAEYRAIGSGRDLAMGAMAMGATAAQAVQVAIKHDRSTGGDIIVEKV
jgi:ATP-dependent protease HslVU (ClpYQ) peptidase subunit